MCLYTQDLTPKIASDDIVCYKVVEITKLWPTIYNCDAEYVSAFRLCPIDLGVRYTHPKSEFVNEQNAETDEGNYVVNGDGYHLFKFYDDAKMFVEHEMPALTMNNPTVAGTRIIKAIIPKGTKYLDGTFWWSWYFKPESIVTKSVIYQPLDGTENINTTEKSQKNE